MSRFASQYGRPRPDLSNDLSQRAAEKGTIAFVSVEYDVRLWEVNTEYDNLARLLR
jgi:hypothetical protein